MSLINDALKRARNLQPPAAVNQVAVSADLLPAESGLRRRLEATPNYLRTLSMASACFALMALGIWAIRESGQTRPVVELAEQPAGSQSTPKAVAEVDPAPGEGAGVKSAKPDSAPSDTGTTSESEPEALEPDKVLSNPVEEPSQMASGVTAVGGTEAAVEMGPKPPQFRLQGIFYHGNDRSSALIKGRMVSRGDEVEGYVIASIEKGTVKFDRQGHFFSLSL